MKILMCVLAVFAASCQAGSIFAASGFYGGVGIDGGYKKFVAKDVFQKFHVPLGAVEELRSFAEVHMGQNVFDVPKVLGDGKGNAIEVVHDNRDSDKLSGHVRYISHGSHYGLSGEQDIKSTKLVLGEGGSSQWQYSDQEVKTIKAILGEDGSDNHSGFGTLHTQEGHLGHDQLRGYRGVGGHSVVETIKVIYAEHGSSDHGEQSSHDIYNGHSGKEGGLDGSGINGAYNGQVGLSEYSGGHVPREGKALKVIHVEGGHDGHISHEDYETFRGNGRYPNTIKVIHYAGGSVAHGGFSQHDGYVNADWDQGIQTIKIIHAGDEAFGHGSFFGKNGYGGQ